VAAVLQELVDLGQPGVDPDDGGGALGEEVVAEASTAVHLDQQPTEVAQLALTGADECAPLPSQEAGVGATGGDPIGAVGVATKERHAWNLLIRAVESAGR
jgi:hypothetical protein